MLTKKQRELLMFLEERISQSGVTPSFEEMKDKAMADVSELRAELQKTANEIKGKTFSMTALSRDGKLYGSITPSVIVNDMIRKELPELKVNASDIIIDEGNIKFVGTYSCKAQFTIF